jgi:hypothetical protein
MNKMKDSNTVVFPFPIMEDLSEELIAQWKCFYEHPIVSSRNQRIEEGLWRRTQNFENKNYSGWKGKNDKRRRMVHYCYSYDLVEDSLKHPVIAITEFYLWWHVCMPANEVAIYTESIYSNLQLGGWRRIYGIGNEEMFYFGNLHIRISQCNPENSIFDQQFSRNFRSDYTILEVTIFSSGNIKDYDFLAQPWNILETGIRKKDVRGSPLLDQWDKLAGLFPAQIELGCGPSIEADIPPLHFLHDIYSVTNKKTGEFILDPYHDCLVRSIAANPKKALVLFGEMYKRCFISKPTNFHYTLKSLHDYGHIVGPVITNNFDGLAHRVGLSELFVRRYDGTHIIPDIEFHPKAKSLIVIGSHADRRRIQHAAREAHLQVVYVDPEGYREAENFVSYPLESVQNQDFLFRVTASEFASKIKDLI